ncbi:MAG TPA: hypothetical protein VKA95_15350 [Nitrososphaeraceae archaeon]|jgi:FlaG/FlaF family flagellin (archaellin)|nr:hypothetical protein [Nitrososphaeraceae archaeon]
MLRKTSVSMMVALVASSLIGISSLHQYVEGQISPQPQQQVQKANYVTGMVRLVTNYASSDGKACIAVVQLPTDKPNNLRIEQGEAIELLAPNESFCTLFGLSKIGKTSITFDAQRITASSLPRTIREDPTRPDYEHTYRVTRVDM